MHYVELIIRFWTRMIVNCFWLVLTPFPEFRSTLTTRIIEKCTGVIERHTPEAGL